MKEKKQKHKRHLTPAGRIFLVLLGIALVALLIYLTYYLLHYKNYDGYKQYLSSYEYETGTDYSPLKTDTDVAGMDLIAENASLGLYADTSSGYIAVLDKRSGQITYSNPLDADDDPVANSSNKNYLKSQFLLYYYNTDVKSGLYDSYSQCVAKKKLTAESIENGIRFTYLIGDLKGMEDESTIYFRIPLEYRLLDDSIEVSIPAGAIEEHGGGYVYRIQLLRYMGAAGTDEEGYIVVPNGSGSIIRFNNGKTSAASYSQYIYDIDPLVSSFYSTENTLSCRLPLFGICRQDSSLLVTVEDGTSTCVLTAGISGIYNSLNYAYPSFVLRNTDNLRNFGDSDSDVYVMEDDIYDINCTVRYTFLDSDYSGYSGIANYYRERLISEGRLSLMEADTDIPFYYDVIAGIRETSHMLGVQYLHTLSMTDFDEAADIAQTLAEDGISNQVMNLQGWFNDGFYNDAVEDVRVIRKLGGKSDLSSLNDTLESLGGRLYADAAIEKITLVDSDYNYNSESSRYYGAGYTATFGELTNPVTLQITTGMKYSELKYSLLSPKYLDRYISKFASRMSKLNVDGISLRDLTNVLTSDKRKTCVVTREEALDIVEAQLQVLDDTGKLLMGNASNAYSFDYLDDIINAPTTDNDYVITDADIPLYEMIIHGCIDYSGQLLNYEDSTHMTETLLNLVEYGASPHYVFTWNESSDMKDTAMSSYYCTTFANWENDAVSAYEFVNDALKNTEGACMVDHEILDNGIRKVTYSNGTVIYVNYSSSELEADGISIPALSCRTEGVR